MTWKREIFRISNKKRPLNRLELSPWVTEYIAISILSFALHFVNWILLCLAFTLWKINFFGFLFDYETFWAPFIRSEKHCHGEFIFINKISYNKRAFEGIPAIWLKWVSILRYLLPKESILTTEQCRNFD